MYEVLDRFSLCDDCVRRQGEHEQLRLVEPKDCSICHGLTSTVQNVSKKILRSLKGYEFSTFCVGLILPPGVQEREDQVRSELKLRGRETIKSEISREISKSIAKATRKSLDKLKPDVTVLVDMGDQSLQFATKPLFIHGRYTKPPGVAQRRDFCEHCSGRGCEACASTGYSREPSVEAIVASKLGKIMNSSKMKFTWLGSEDAESEVRPPGRPMIIELKSPRKRAPPRRLRLLTGKGRIELSGLKVLVGRPTRLPTFVFLTKAVIKPTERIVRQDLAKLSRQMRMAQIQFQTSKGKLVYRTVHSIRARVVKGKVVAEIKMDGGLPVKRLVSGDSTSPSISEMLKTPLVCEKFDILKVWERGSFKFG